MSLKINKPHQKAPNYIKLENKINTQIKIQTEDHFRFGLSILDN